MKKEKITTPKIIDNKKELKKFYNFFESSGVFTESEKNIILEIVQLMVKSFEIFYKSLGKCAGLNFNRSKYAKYLFLNENINEEFDSENFNDNYPSNDIFFPQAIFRYDLENFIERINLNVKNRSINKSNSIKNSIFKIVHRFALSLDRGDNHPYRFYFTQKTVSDNVVPKNIRFLIEQYNADLIDKLYEKLIEYDKKHIILIDLFNKKEIYKGHIMGERCLGFKIKDIKRKKKFLKKKAEIEAGFRPDENPCDDTKEANYLREMNLRKCVEDETGLPYLSEEYCDYFNELYQVYIEKLPPINNDTEINTEQITNKDVNTKFNQRKGSKTVSHEQKGDNNVFNNHEAESKPVLNRRELNKRSIIMDNLFFNLEDTNQKVISYDQTYKKFNPIHTTDTNAFQNGFFLIFPVIILFYFVYIVIKRRQTFNK